MPDRFVAVDGPSGPTDHGCISARYADDGGMSTAPDLVLEQCDAASPPPEWLIGQTRLLWADPPYGTGKVQRRGDNNYLDQEDTAYVVSAILSWLPAMADDGTVVVCCDYRLSPDLIVAIKHAGWVYRGEVIWTFGLGRPRTSWWPVRHNNIVTFTRTEGSGLWDKSAVPSERRLAPKPGYSDDRPAGSVWDYTMSNTHPDRVQYPNQKPITIIEPFVKAHTNVGDIVVDPFMGSGSTGVAATRLGRRFYGRDTNSDALLLSKKRIDRTKAGQWMRPQIADAHSTGRMPSVLPALTTGDHDG